MRKTIILFFALCFSVQIAAQGTFSGDLMMNLNFFQRDTNIHAAVNPLYDNYLSGSEAWLDLRYNINGFTFFARADAFNNSNLYSPAQALSGFGLGAWNITKDMKDLSISMGYIYDQIGSGILFRSYEDRGLLIDNALVGLELKYKLAKNISVKGFTGQQKFLFNRYNPIIRGINAEGDFSINKLHLMPGIGAINRTIDQASMNSIVANINGQELATRFVPKYNMYAFTVYNTLTYKNLSWYAEGAYKTDEAIIENPLTKLLVDKPGNIEYTSINYGQKGLALSLTGKRTEDYIMLTSPNEASNVNSGMLNWQPVIAVLRPERVMSLYTPASQNISEMAFTGNLLISPNDVTNFSFTYTNINNLTNTKLFREGYADVYYQGLKSWVLQAGLQYLEYNQAAYLVSTLKQPIDFCFTPFGEITYKINDNHSIRLEGSYMSTKQYYGSWIFALLEYNVAPKFSVSVSDMYDVNPNNGESKPDGFSTTPTHYYNIYGAYTKGSNRFSVAYVKQVAGINCSGGVCRYEPAFSGLRCTVTSSF